jgi:glycosyltransferase involved in cell wall biosynthesis
MKAFQVVFHPSTDYSGFMDKRKKVPRVLQIVPALDMGGVERGTIDLAIFLKKKGASPVVASCGGRLVSVLRKNEIIHEYLPLDSKNPFIIWINSIKLANLIRKHQINIVHVRSRAPAWSAYIAAKKTHTSLVTTFHGVYSFQGKLKKFYNSVMTKGLKVIAVSKFMARHIEKEYGLNPKKISTISRGVDFNIFDPNRVTELRIEGLMTQLQLPDDKFIILLPGRLTRLKGHAVLLEALSRLQRKDWICLFVGVEKNKAYVQELEEQAAQYGFRDRLHIVGECKDMPALYKLASLVICPSSQPESFGRTAAEASAMGSIVIASNHGGFQEIIEDGKTGWLFPSEDSRSLAIHIENALNLSSEERKSMGNAGIENVRHQFDNETMFKKTLKVYHDILTPVS